MTIFGALFAVSAALWQQTGHFTVCEIGYRHLTDRSRAAVDRIMGGKPFPQQCTWPDQVRSQPAWRHTDPWHYVNVEDEQNYWEVVTEKGDVVQALLRAEDELRKPELPNSDKANWLKFIGHFTGDIHQPLHAGKAADRGGNLITVTWFGQETNLHRVWDVHMLDKFIEERALADDSENHFRGYAEELEKLPSPPPADDDSTALDWATESLRERRKAYDIGDGNLGDDYYRRNIGMLNHRLRAAGYRLAALLNRIFDSDGSLRPQDIELREKMKEALARNRAESPD